MFSYKNSYHSSIHKAPYEDLYRIRYTYPIGWFAVDDKVYLKIPPRKGGIEVCLEGET